MWNRFTGRSSEAAGSHHSAKSGNSNSVKRRSSESSKKPSARGDDRDRGFTPISTSYSSSTRSAFPNTAPASVASSHAYASARPCEVSYEPPDLIRNASLANEMPKSRTERSGRGGDDRDGDRRRDRSLSQDKQERRERRRKSEKPRQKSETDRGTTRSVNDYDGAAETARGDFEDQISAPGFAQFPGQTSGGFVGGPPSHANAVSPRVADQFPGQMHEQSSDPLRRPLSINQGGPGLAADYYGDAGQSVSEQPGVRIQSPSLIIGAEPHLQPASSTVAPPPEPSTTGQMGAAASFYSGNLSEDTYQDSGNHQPNPHANASNPTQPPSQTSSHHNPGLGGVAAGAAAGYILSGHESSHSQRPDVKPYNGGSYSHVSNPPSQRPPPQAHTSHIGSDVASGPSKFDEPSHSSNAGLYAAGAAGAAGLAAAAYHQHHNGHDGGHTSAAYQQHQAHYNSHQSASFQHQNGNSTVQRHRHQGPLAKVVDFFKDPEGVAEFEEYTEYIGVCRHCFDPRSTPRDAPRKHRYRRRRSDERLISSTRVDKLSRYSPSSSEDEKNRKGSWLGAGIAGYGLGKVGQTLFNQRNGFGDIYNEKSARRHSSRSPNRNSQVLHDTTRNSSRKVRRRSRSRDRVDDGITSDGKMYRKERDSDKKGTAYLAKRRSRSSSRSSSRSRRRRSSLAGVAVGSTVGSSIAASSDVGRKSRLPKESFVRTSRSRKEREDDVGSVLYINGNEDRVSDSALQRRRSKKAKKKSRGFFSFSNSSSSSTDNHLAFDMDGEKVSHRRKSKPKSKNTDHRKAEAAMFGLGAAAAALAASSSSSRKPGRVSELVATKESGVRHTEGSRTKRHGTSSISAEDEAWESATEGDSASADLELAYGASLRRKASHSSMSSDSSGLSKWGWRWGDRSKKAKKQRREEQIPHSGITPVGTVAGIDVAANLYQQHQYPHQPNTFSSDVPVKDVGPQAVAGQGVYDTAVQQPYQPIYGEFVDRQVPIQHPRPIVPILSVLHKPEGQYVPSMAEVSLGSRFSQTAQAPSQRPPNVFNERNVPRPNLPGSFPDGGPAFSMPIKAVSETTGKIERRVSSPSSRSAEITPKRKKPQREDSSVRFELTEEQSDKDRRERRRRRREEREQREAEETVLDKTAKDHERSASSEKPERRRRSSEADAKDLLVDATTIGAATAAGIAIAADLSKGRDEKEETSDQRRERRRKKRQERSSRLIQDAANPPPVSELSRRATDPSDQQSSSSFFSNSTSTSAHESYAAFFAPEATLARDPQAKETNPDPNAGVDLSTRDLSSTSGIPSEEELTHIVDPTFNEYGEEIRPFRPQDWVPKLKLAKPTPTPSTAGSVRGDDSPVIEAHEKTRQVSRHSAEGVDLPKITAIEPETDEVTIIKPKGINSPTSTIDDDLEGPFISMAQDQPADLNEYPDDPVFAATVAAGLQDAGFDPEIAIKDPTFRRRDSPPGSGEYRAPSHRDQCSVEGGTIEPSLDDKDDDDVGDRMGKRERRRKDKKAKRRSTEDRSAESAVIEDYEQPSRVTEEPDSFEDISKPPSDDKIEQVNEQSSRSTALKDGSNDAAMRTRNEASIDQDSDARSTMNDSIIEGPQSSKKSKKKSKRKASGPGVSELAEEIATPAANAETETSGSTAESKKDRKGGSLWGLFRKSRESVAEPPLEEQPVTELQDGFGKPEDKTKSSRKRKSTKGDENIPYPDNGGDEGVLPAAEIGRISQDLPAQNPNELKSMSFLGERPEPPPPPDNSPTPDIPQPHAPSLQPALPITQGMRNEIELPREMFSDLEGIHSSENHNHRVNEIQRAEGSQPVSQTSSPTAVPYVFRMPSSPGTSRTGSLPPTPSRTENTQSSQRPKIRPKSTEFKLSTEFRPMWLLERHRSRQDESVAETFPSLPSSHTTSRASSVHDPEEDYMTREQYDEMVEANRKDSARRTLLVVDTSKFYTTDDLLDSQQATPTASSFPAMLKGSNENAQESSVHDETEAAEAAASAEWDEYRMLPSPRRESFDNPPPSSVDEFESAQGSPPLSPTSNIASSPAQSRSVLSNHSAAGRSTGLARSAEPPSLKYEDQAPVTSLNIDSRGMMDGNATLLTKRPVAHPSDTSDPQKAVKLTQGMPEEEIEESTVTTVEATARGSTDQAQENETEQIKQEIGDLRDFTAWKGSITNEDLAFSKNVDDNRENEENLDALVASTKKGKKAKNKKRQSKQHGSADMNRGMPNEDALFNDVDINTPDQLVVADEMLGDRQVTTGGSLSSPKEVTGDCIAAPIGKSGKKAKKSKRLSTDLFDDREDVPPSEDQITKESDTKSSTVQGQVAEKASISKQEMNEVSDIAIKTPLPKQGSEEVMEITQIDRSSPIQPIAGHGKPNLDAVGTVPADIVANRLPELDLEEVESRIQQGSQPDIVSVVGVEDNGIEDAIKENRGLAFEQYRELPVDPEREIPIKGPEDDDWADFGPKRSKKAKKQKKRAKSSQLDIADAQSPAFKDLATGIAIAGGSALAATTSVEDGNKQRPENETTEFNAPVVSAESSAQPVSGSPVVSGPNEEEALDVWQPDSKQKKKSIKGQPVDTHKLVDDGEVTKTAPSLTSTHSTVEPRVGPISLSAAADGVPLPPPLHSSGSPKVSRNEEPLLTLPVDDQADVVHSEISIVENTGRSEASEGPDHSFAITNTADEIRSMLAITSDSHVEAPYVAPKVEANVFSETKETGFSAAKGDVFRETRLADLQQEPDQARETLEIQNEPEVIRLPAESHLFEKLVEPVQVEEIHGSQGDLVKQERIVPGAEDQTSIHDHSKARAFDEPTSLEQSQGQDLGEASEQAAPATVAEGVFEDVPKSKKDKKKSKSQKVLALGEGEIKIFHQTDKLLREPENGEQSLERGLISKSKDGLDKLAEDQATVAEVLPDEFVTEKSKRKGKKGKKGKKLFTFDDYDDNNEAPPQDREPQVDPAIEQPGEVLGYTSLEPEIVDTAPIIQPTDIERSIASFGGDPIPTQPSANSEFVSKDVQDPAEPDKGQIDEVLQANKVKETPKSKKDKKRATESKALRWNSMEDQLPPEATPLAPTPPDLEDARSFGGEESLQNSDNPLLAYNDIHMEAFKGQKDNKEANKNKALAWQEADALNAADVEVPEVSSTPPREVVAPVSGTADDTVEDVPGLNSSVAADAEDVEPSFTLKSKKDKKKAKKIKSQILDEIVAPNTAEASEPSVPIQEFTPTRSEAPRKVENDTSALISDVPAAIDEDLPFNTPKSTKDKKKAKKAKSSMWEEKSVAKPETAEVPREPAMSVEETMPVRPGFLDEKEKDVTTEALNAPAEDIADLLRDNVKSKKEKKKGKKNKTALCDEPSEGPAAGDSQAEQVAESLQQSVLAERPVNSVEDTTGPLNRPIPLIEEATWADGNGDLLTDKPSLPVHKPTSFDEQPAIPIEEPVLATKQASHIIDMTPTFSEEAALTDGKTSLLGDEAPPESSDLPRDALAESIEDAPADPHKSKKGKKKVKQSKALDLDEPEEIPTPDNTEDLSAARTAEDLIVASEDPDKALHSVVNKAPQESTLDFPKSKRDKKKSKKSKALTWDESAELPASEDVKDLSAIQLAEDPIAATKDPEIVLPITVDEGPQELAMKVLKPKKDKKKSRKLKAVFDDETSETPVAGDSDFPNTSRSIGDIVVPAQDIEALPNAPAETVDNLFNEVATSRKAKNRGKKAKALERNDPSEALTVENFEEPPVALYEVEEGPNAPVEPTVSEPVGEVAEEFQDDRLAPKNSIVPPITQDENDTSATFSHEPTRELTSASEPLPMQPDDDNGDADFGGKSRKTSKQTPIEDWGFPDHPEIAKSQGPGRDGHNEESSIVGSKRNDDRPKASQYEQSMEGIGDRLQIHQSTETVPESTIAPQGKPTKSAKKFETDDIESGVQRFYEAPLVPFESDLVSALAQSSSTQKLEVEDHADSQKFPLGIEPEAEQVQGLEPEPTFSLKKSKKDKMRAKEAGEFDVEFNDAQQDDSTSHTPGDSVLAEDLPKGEKSIDTELTETSEAFAVPLLSRKQSKKDKKRESQNQLITLDIPQIIEEPKLNNSRTVTRDLSDPELAMEQEAEVDLEREFSVTSKKGKKDKKKSKKTNATEFYEPSEATNVFNIDDTIREPVTALKEPSAEPAIEPLTEPTDQSGFLGNIASDGIGEISEQTIDPSTLEQPTRNSQEILDATQEIPTSTGKKQKGKKSKKLQAQQLDWDIPGSMEVFAAAEDDSQDIQEQKPSVEMAIMEEKPAVNGKDVKITQKVHSDPLEPPNKLTLAEDQPQTLVEDAGFELSDKPTKKGKMGKKSRKIDEILEPGEAEEMEDLLMKPPAELTEDEHRRISEIPITIESDVEPQPKDDESSVDIPDVLLKAPEDLTEVEREQISQLPQNTQEPVQSSLEISNPLTIQTESSFKKAEQGVPARFGTYPVLFEQGVTDLPTIKEGQVLVEENIDGHTPSIDDADRNVSDGAASYHEPMQENSRGLNDARSDEPREEDDFPVFSTSRKSKKSKKNKKEKKIEVWEDETATPPAVSEGDIESGARDKLTLDISRDVQEQLDFGSPRVDLVDEPLNASDEPSRQGVPQDAAIIPEDDWLASSVKKSKKNRKSKKRQEQEQAESRDLSRAGRESIEEAYPSESAANNYVADTSFKDSFAQDHSARVTSTSLDDVTQGEENSGKMQATAAGLGAGAIAATLLSRKDSKKQGKKEEEKKKKKKRSSQQVEEVDEDPEDFDFDRQELRATSPPISEGRSGTPDQQLQLLKGSDQVVYNAHQPDIPYSSSAPLQNINRDSGIVVNDSPRISENPHMRQMVRDSGYQGADDSPVVGYSPEPRDYSMEREDGADDPFTRVVEPRESRSRRKRRSRRDRDISEDQSASARGLSASQEVTDSRTQRTRPYSPTARSPELSDQDTQLGHSRHRGLNTEMVQTEHLASDSPREPSPVSSTTKDRSSVLFDSSPSNRHEISVRQESSPPCSPTQSPAQDTTDAEDRVPQPMLVAPPTEQAAEPRRRSMSPESISPARNAAPFHRSIFGGPVSERRELISPPQSPFAHDGSHLPRLDTITEHSPEESPLHKSRALSDLGSPERGIKSLRRSRSPKSLSRSRVRTPGTPDNDPSKVVTSNQLDSCLSWPAVDDDQHSVDLERSRSRNIDKRMPSRLNEVSTPVMPPPPKQDQRNTSGGSAHSTESINAIIRTPPPDQMRSASGLSYRSSGTPPLRRSDRSVSSDLRLANKKSEAKSLGKRTTADLRGVDDVDNIPSSSTYDPVTDKGKTRAKDMADVYEGLGHVPGGSPLSPTRPPSVRRRQSMQMLDLEQRLDQVVSENRLLADAKLRAERGLDEVARDHAQSSNAMREAIETRDVYLAQKNQELEELRHMLDGLRTQVAQLNQVNEGRSGNRGVGEDHEEKYRQLESDHNHVREQWQQSTRELEDLRQQHDGLSGSMESIVATQVASALASKNAEFNRTQEELRRAHEELEQARQQIRTLQQQILASKSSTDSLSTDRDEDYFDTQCQALCQHVQQWVLRFSKSSDDRACFLAEEIRDEKICDRFENAILDGTDADSYLSDRVKRRDVFMSVFMTMLWEYIFTRYLFGMDREQRQKLKSLEKTLNEVGPASAVQKWRATTLSLLAKRDAFASQRAQDTEAVVHEIYGTLSTFLPPPAAKAEQLQSSLRRVVALAVDLSIEMRTQRSEYIMLPPLQPEFNTNGDLARNVYFNANLMNERSGATISNEALEQEGAAVRMVLFPLVVKKGEGDEEIVVCPAQVLCQEKKEGKRVRVVSAQPSTVTGTLGNVSNVEMGGMF